MNPVLQIMLALDASAFAAGTKKAEASMNSLVASIGSRVGAYLSVGAIYGQVSQVLRLADDIGDMSAKLGVSTDRIQEFQYAARKTGASVESFTTAIRSLIAAQQDAITKGEASEAFKPFATLGLSFAELQRLSPDQLLYRVGAAFKNSSQEGQQLDAVISLLGRGAMDLLGALREGLNELGREAHTLGQVMGKDLVEGLGRANDQLDVMKHQVTVGIATEVGWVYTLYAKLVAAWTRDLVMVSNLRSQGLLKAQNMGVLAGKKVLSDMGIEPMLTEPEAKALIAEKYGPKKAKPREKDMWDRIGDPGEVIAWKAYSTEEERKTPLSFGSADALARIGLFRGGYDPGEHTRLQQLTELRALNRALARTNQLLTDE